LHKVAVWCGVGWDIIWGVTMKVVFLKDVPNVASAGQMKEVADGYGRNYLIPKKLAVLATSAELKKLEAQRQAEARREAKFGAEAGALSQAIASLEIKLSAKVGEQNRLYGSITSGDIAAEVQRLTGKEIDKRKVELAEPIKELGSYEIPIKLSKDITAKVKVLVEEKKADKEEKA